MTSREIVIKAINRQSPPRYPIYYFNRYPERSDIVAVGYNVSKNFIPSKAGMTEWGYVWKTLNGTMGQPENHPLVDWEDFGDYRFPDPEALGRYDHIPEFIRTNKDKFIIGSLNISGFNNVTFIRGFENTLEDLCLEPEKIEKLTDKVMNFENGVISNFAKQKIDAVAFSDDWGTQQGMMISPAMWRQYFKERYRKQFKLVHDLGMYVYFHCCGQIIDIIPDLIEIGADILNLNQPDIFGIEKLGDLFSGKICFNCPVDHQTVAITGNRTEIFSYVRNLKECLGVNGGGFIANIEEYSSIGMTEDNFNNIMEAFEFYKWY